MGEHLGPRVGMALALPSEVLASDRLAMGHPGGLVLQQPRDELGELASLVRHFQDTGVFKGDPFGSNGGCNDWDARLQRLDRLLLHP